MSRHVNALRQFGNTPIKQTQDVIDRLADNCSLSETRRRDLRSAVVTFGKLIDRAPALIPLDLAAIRAGLDAMVPVQAKISRKRWANLRSDLVAAIEASGLRPMLKTKTIRLDARCSTKSALRWMHGKIPTCKLLHEPISER
jgi:hypothetical protein